MTDVATLDLDVNSSKLTAAERAQDRFARSAEDMERRARKATDAIQQGFEAVGGQSGALVKSARSFDQLRSSIDPAFAAAQKYKQVQQELAGMVARGEASQRSANLALEQAASWYMGVETSAERAARAVRESEAATETARRGFESLRMSVDDIYASSMRYENAVNQVNAALRSGVITQDQANRVLDQAAQRFLTAQGAASRFGDTMQMAGGHVANMTFQFQDIAMMLAAGQNPLMLAMQQGTQISGIFMQAGGNIKNAGSLIAGAFAGLLSPISLVTIGTIAAIGYIVKWFTAAEDGATTMADAIDRMSGSVSELQRITDLFADTDLSGIRDQFGDLNEEILRMLELQREIAIMDAMRGVSQAMTVAMESMNGWITTQLDGIRGAFDTTYDNARRIQRLMENVRDAATPEDALRATVELRGHIESTVGPMTSLTGEAYEMARGLLQSESALRQVVVQAERSEAALENAESAANAVARAAGSIAPNLNAASAAAAVLSQNLASAAGAQAALIRAEEGINAEAALAASQARLDAAIAGQDELAAATAAYRAQLEVQMGAVEDLEGADRAYRDAIINREVAAFEAAERNRIATRANEEAYRDLTTAVNGAGSATSGAARAVDDATDSMEAMSAEMRQPLISAIDNVANAFGDFVARGFRDFKGFARSILDSFKNMLAQMIAMAARNRIMISLGLGGGSVGGTMAQAATGGIGNLLGLGGGAGGGIGGVLGNLATGAGRLLGFGGAFTGTFGAGLGATLTGGLSGMTGAIGSGLGMIGTGAGSTAAGLSMALGAALPVIGGVLAAFSLFRKRTTRTVEEIDNGLTGLIGAFNSSIQAFQTIQTTTTTKRLFRKRTSTSVDTTYTPFSGLDASILEMQNSIAAAANAFGFGADAFNGFSYSFRVSLKDLSEDQKASAINAELERMGDAFAAMLPNFQSMNELMEAYNQRIALEDRLLALQGKSAELLARQRDRERAATHELNLAILEQIYALEDQAAANEAATRAMMENNLFVTAQDRQFAATAFGNTRQMPQQLSPEERELMVELIRSIREGNINNARLLTDIKRIEERRDLEPMA